MNKIFATSAAALAAATFGSAATAEDITLRIGSGHPPGVVYAGLMIDYFQKELKERVEARTEHTVNFVEGYSGSIVKVTEVLEGVQDGILDIGGFCFCFEPSNLPLHAFQVMMPFGTMDPEVSLKIAQEVYAEVPYLTDVFEDKFNQVQSINARDDGTLWVQTSRGAWELDEGEMAGYDIFDKAGKLIRQVVLKGQGNPQQDGYFFVGDRLFVVTGWLDALMALQGGGGQGAEEEEDLEEDEVLMEIISYRVK